ncbi:MAG: bifunctional enoyl-CoA hydratase/phosphate acetyltransferase [Bacteroidales bacterium]|nr:bifunctional enoyl-CoA hydratase/phosphate acetyltransferase [Bacteroidales bacterium]
MLKSLEKLVEIACKKGVRKLVVAVAEEEDVLMAIRKAYEVGFIDPLLIGDTEKIKTAARAAEFDLSGINILHEPVQALACENAAQIIADGKASILMKGMVSTSILMRAFLNKELGLTKGNLLSHVALFESPYYHKIFCVTDAALNVAPDMNDKIAIIQNAVKVYHALGIKIPKVGILAAVETVNPKMEATLHAAAFKAMNQRNQLSGCIVDGPFALDNAVSSEAAAHKNIRSEVAGDVDILVTPDINSGNILYKALNFLGGAVTAAIITGGAVPIVLTSRADTETSKYLSIALAAALG